MQNKKKMSLDDFARINRNTNEGEPMPRDLLESIYASIARDELKISSGAWAAAAAFACVCVRDGGLVGRAAGGRMCLLGREGSTGPHGSVGREGHRGHLSVELGIPLSECKVAVHVCVSVCVWWGGCWQAHRALPISVSVGCDRTHHLAACPTPAILGN